MMNEAEIKAIQSYIVDHAAEAGYTVTNTAYSSTSFGKSAYIYLHHHASHLNIKVRVSDHSTGFDRTNDETGLFSREDAISFLTKSWKARRVNTHRFESKQIKASAMIEGDQITREFTTPKGVQYVVVRRPIFETVYTLDA